MAERTPPTAAIRQAWIGAHPFRTTTTVEEREAEFDRWLTEVRREAWDEAVDTLSRHWEDFAPAAVADLERRNPYRKETDRG